MVPADVRLLTSKDLFVSQTALAGEALPVEKYEPSELSNGKVAPPRADAQANLLEAPTLCFMGTNVVSGTATAVVVATGGHAYFGSLARSGAGQRALTGFDFARWRMTVVVEKERHQHLLICKGAVEELLNICAQAESDGDIVPLDEALRRQAKAVARGLNEAGMRVLAVAYKKMAEPKFPYSVADESDLTLAGFLALLDPPKEIAADAIRALAQHGVEVKVLTGDNEVVTRKICREVGLEAPQSVLGRDLERKSDSELEELVGRTTIFAKLSPTQKARVIKALQRRGHTVSFLGDGINDAPALREADAGISVDTAVDIAKESADIVLLEKSLLILEEGVIEGRRTFGNIIKYISCEASKQKTLTAAPQL